MCVAGAAFLLPGLLNGYGKIEHNLRHHMEVIKAIEGDWRASSEDWGLKGLLRGTASSWDLSVAMRGKIETDASQISARA